MVNPTSRLRECIFSDYVIIQQHRFEILQCGEIEKFQCPKCNHPHDGFIIIGQNDSLSYREFLIFQADKGCTNQIYVFQPPIEIFADVREKLNYGLVANTDLISHFFSTHFADREELLSILRKIFLLLNGEHVKDLTGVSLYFDFNSNEEIGGIVGGQYTTYIEFEYAEFFFDEFKRIFPNLRKVEGKEAETEFDNLLKHHISLITIPFEATNQTPDQFLDNLWNTYMNMVSEGKSFSIW